MWRLVHLGNQRIRREDEEKNEKQLIFHGDKISMDEGDKWKNRQFFIN